MKTKKIYPQQVRKWLAMGYSLIKIRDIFHANGNHSITLADLRRLYGNENELKKTTIIQTTELK